MEGIRADNLVSDRLLLNKIGSEQESDGPAILQPSLMMGLQVPGAGGPADTTNANVYRSRSDAAPPIAGDVEVTARIPFSSETADPPLDCHPRPLATG